MIYISLLVIFVFLFTNCKKETLPLSPNEEQPELSWNSLNYPISENEGNRILATAVNSNCDVFVGTNTGRVLRLLSGDSVWNEVTRLGWHPISFIFINEDSCLFIGTQQSGSFWYGVVEYSEDNGENWRGIFNKLRDTYCFTTYQNHYYSAGYFAVSISEDNGQSWVKIDSLIEDKVVRGLAIDQSNGDIYISIWNTGVLCSKDDGRTWAANAFEGWDVDPLFSTENGYIFAGTGGGVYRSMDHGDSWQKLEDGIGDVFVQCFASNLNNYIIVGTQKDGLLLSKNFGDSWTNVGFKNISISSVAFDSKNFAYIGTDSIGVLKSTIPLDY